MDSKAVYGTFVKDEDAANERRQRGSRGPFAIFEEWQRRLASGANAKLDEVVDLEGYTENCLGLTGWTTGFGIAAQNFYKNVVQPFAEQTSVVEEVVEGETSVAVRLHQSGKHVGEFLGIPPTGRRVTWDTVAIVHVRDGKVVGQWVQMDLHGLRAQLSAPP
jgi:predicted ester cyclase